MKKIGLFALSLFVGLAFLLGPASDSFAEKEVC